MSRLDWRRIWRQAETRVAWQRTFGPLPWWYAPLARAEAWLRKNLPRSQK